jgi:hypothetical protein
MQNHTTEIVGKRANWGDKFVNIFQQANYMLWKPWSPTSESGKHLRHDTRNTKSHTKNHTTEIVGKRANWGDKCVIIFQQPNYMF